MQLHAPASRVCPTAEAILLPRRAQQRAAFSKALPARRHNPAAWLWLSVCAVPTDEIDQSSPIAAPAGARARFNDKGIAYAGAVAQRRSFVVVYGDAGARIGLQHRRRPPNKLRSSCSRVCRQAVRGQHRAALIGLIYQRTATASA